MGHNADELVSGSPVSWWTCVKATSGSPDARSRILASRRLFVLLLLVSRSSSTSTPSPKISGDFTFRFLRYLSFPFLRLVRGCRNIGPVWLTVTGFCEYTHAASVPHDTRAPAFACEREPLREGRNTMGPRRCLLPIHFGDSRFERERCVFAVPVKLRGIFEYGLDKSEEANLERYAPFSA